MDPTLALFLGILIGLLAGAAVGALLVRRTRSADGSPADGALLSARHEAELGRVRADAQAERAELMADLARMEATADQLSSQLEDARREREERALRDRQESSVLQALSPVRESLGEMQRRVAEMETQRQRQHGELSQQLRSATESEERLRATAESLASALRNNATRGVWGETQLRSVVEAAGMLERVDFDVQTSISSDAGPGRPDMVVHLPGGKDIAVDAKVPFSAYLDAASIPPTAAPEELARRERLLRDHVKAVRDHITTLGSKAYWDGLAASPEMVIAFIPSESLVSSALEADPGIMEFAFSKRVALASPVTLWSVLKTVAFSWQQDLVTQEAQELFDASRTLYARFSTMAGHIDKLGRSVRGTVADYNRFVGSLERQVLPAARRLGRIDESKVLPVPAEVEDAPRELSAYELVADSPLEGPDERSEKDDETTG